VVDGGGSGNLFPYCPCIRESLSLVCRRCVWLGSHWGGVCVGVRLCVVLSSVFLVLSGNFSLFLLLNTMKHSSPPSLEKKKHQWSVKIVLTVF
jgi:hypothetical protein